MAFLPLSTRARRGLVLPLALFVLWEVCSHLGWIDNRFLPPLETIAVTAWTEIKNGDLFHNIGASLARNVIGFSIGGILGIAFGALLGLSRTADALFGPTFHSLKQIAILAWIPIISIWFGFAETAKITFIALAAFIPVALNTIEGIRSAQPQFLEVARVLRFNRYQTLRHVYFPSAVPSILTGIHLGLIYSWLATVGAEYFMAVGPGIGGLIIAGRERFEMDLVMLGVVILGGIGFAFNGLASWIETRSLRWRDDT